MLWNKEGEVCRRVSRSGKMFGTIHIAFSNNSDMPGGKNKSKNLSKPTVKVFDKKDSCMNVLVDGFPALIACYC